MKEHLARERHFKETCLYCGRSMDTKEWKTLHHREALYKVAHCECGKKAMVRMPFFGSGHDSWSKTSLTDAPRQANRQTRLRTLESKLKIVGGEK